MIPPRIMFIHPHKGADLPGPATLNTHIRARNCRKYSGWLIVKLLRWRLCTCPAGVCYPMGRDGVKEARQ